MTDRISRADAIEHLKNVKVSYPHADISLPIDLAIKAIEILPSAETSQNLTRPNKELKGSDLISRADAIEAVKETKPIVRSTERNWGKMIAEQHSKELVKALKALPSADAVDVAHDIPEYCSWSQTYTNMVQSAMSKASSDAVQGEWVDIDNYYRMATCSRCHKVTMFEKWGEYTKPYDFCPNCGARMKGGAE